MNPIGAIDSTLAAAPVLTRLGVTPPAPPASVATTSFSDILSAGIGGVQAKLDTADGLVRRFTLDGNIPVHQVTYALEEARLSVELAMQVRGRLLDGYRELMNMQL